MSPGPIDDESDLNAPRIHVGARCGWMLRMARTLHGGVPRLADMADATGATTARVHRLETGVRRDGRLIDAYEEVLGVPCGSLRAPVDVACRTFPESPRDVDPSPRLTTVGRISATTELLVAALESPDHGWAGPPRAGVDGGVWLDWARAASQPAAAGLPLPVVRDLVGRLISELGRSVGAGYPTRYEALSLLRCGPFGDVVVEEARRSIDDPDVQVLNDLMSAVGEAVTPEAVAWVVSLLSDPRDRVMAAACLSVENMAQILPDALPLWRRIIDPVTAAFNASEVGSDRHGWLSHVLRLAPREVRAAARAHPHQPLAPDAALGSWSRTRLNEHWSECERRAGDICARLGLPDQPMLARLLFDVGMGPLEARAVTGYMLLGALPTLSTLVAEQLADLAERHPDPVIRERATRRLPGASHGQPPPDVVRRWLEPDAPADLRAAALNLLAASGERPPPGPMRASLRAGGVGGKHALYAAGMTRHPVLHELLDDPDVDVRGGAHWWLRHGGRVAV